MIRPFFSSLWAFALLISAGALFAAPAGPLPKYDNELLTAYVHIAIALAGDDLTTAQTAAATLSRQAEASGDVALVAPAKAVAGASDMGKARAAFKTLSDEVEPLAVREEKVTVMYCPMAKASWIQPNGPVANPYYGKSMLRCGGPKPKN